MKNAVICQLSDFSPEYGGSFADSLLCLARYCRQEMQLETLCVFPEAARGRAWLRRFNSEQIKYAFVPQKRNIISPLRTLLSGLKPLIFHSHFETFDVAPMFLKLLEYRDAKIVWQLHSVAQLTLRQRIKDAVKVKVLARMLGDAYIAVGDGAYRNAIDRGFPSVRLFNNHNAINIGRFSPDGKRRERLQALLGARRKTVFLLLGYDPLLKGVDLFVKAAENLNRNASQDSLFLIVGRQETREFVSNLPESSRLNGTLRVVDPTDEFPLLLSGIDVLVAPSRREGFGYAVVEAMAARKLILCSDIPGIRDSYGKSHGVWLFPSEDWEQLTLLMRKAATLSPAEREYLGKINSDHAAVYYSLDAWVKKMGLVYTRLLNDAGNR